MTTANSNAAILRSHSSVFCYQSGALATKNVCNMGTRKLICPMKISSSSFQSFADSTLHMFCNSQLLHGETSVSRRQVCVFAVDSFARVNEPSLNHNDLATLTPLDQVDTPISIFAKLRG